MLGAIGVHLLEAHRVKWSRLVGDHVAFVRRRGEGLDGGDAAFLPVEVFEVGVDVLEARELYGRDEAVFDSGARWIHQT